MATDPILHRRSTNAWRNWHQTYAADADRRYELHRGSGPMSATGFRKSAKLVLDLINKARAEGKVLRSLAGTWSFSQVTGQQDAWLLDTTQANWKARLSRGALDPSFAGDPDDLLLVQCGASIFEINRYLERDRGRSLMTTGASNGQTYVGAMSTSTHGSALSHAAMPGQVAAIQMLCPDGRNLWLERPADPVISVNTANDFGAQIVRDDSLFEATLVSLGLLGVIHAVVIRTRPIFLLSASQFEHPYNDDLKHAMRTLDTSRVSLPAEVDVPPGNPRPYFFQVVVSPHKPNTPAYVKLMYERPFPAGYKIDYREAGKYGAAYDIAGVVGGLLDAIEPLTPLLTNAIIAQELKSFFNKTGTWGETFDFTTPRAHTAGAALAVPAERSVEAVDLALATYRETGPAPVVFACRFTQQTPGLLAFQRFSPTCIMDIDGLNSVNTHLVMEAVRQAFDDATIPYAQHWGKFHDQRNGRLERSYGADLVAFRQARHQLLPSAADKRTFSLVAAETVVGL